MNLYVTHNFKRNLEDIEDFLAEIDAHSQFETLLDDLFGQILPMLERFPESGIDFFRHPPRSQAVLQRIEALRQLFGEELHLRELIHGDFLLLYSIRNENLYLLSIKHHRQLSFDLHGHLTE